MPRYAVAYDIADNSRRRKVANLLDSFGDRVQNSVFELVVSRSMLTQCLKSVKELLNLQEDKLVVYFLCQTCESKRTYIGSVDGITNIGDEHVFVV